MQKLKPKAAACQAALERMEKINSQTPISSLSTTGRQRFMNLNQAAGAGESVNMTYHLCDGDKADMNIRVFEKTI